MHTVLFRRWFRQVSVFPLVIACRHCGAEHIYQLAVSPEACKVCGFAGGAVPLALADMSGAEKAALRRGEAVC